MNDASSRQRRSHEDSATFIQPALASHLSSLVPRLTRAILSEMIPPVVDVACTLACRILTSAVRERFRVGVPTTVQEREERWAAALSNH